MASQFSARNITTLGAWGVSFQAFHGGGFIPVMFRRIFYLTFTQKMVFNLKFAQKLYFYLPFGKSMTFDVEA